MPHIRFEGRLAAVLLSIALLTFLGRSNAAVADPATFLTIHYHRFDGDYTDAGLWVWDVDGRRQPANEEVLAAERTEFGVKFLIDTSLYGPEEPGAHRRIGFIPRLRRSWDHKDGSDRVWTPNLGDEIWLIGNDPAIYTSLPDISPRLIGAYLDGRRSVVAMLSHPASGEQAGASLSVTIRDDSGADVPVATAQGGRRPRLRVDITTAADLDPARLYTVAIAGFKPATLVPRGILDDPELFHSDAPMGAVYSPERTTFRLFSPSATAAHVILYANATGEEGRTELPLAHVGRKIWETTVEGDLEGRHYMFRVDTRQFGRSAEAWDPYAVNTTGNDGRPRVTNLRKTDPPAFRPVQRPAFKGTLADAVIYEMHVRDFTIHPSSGAKNRGKYLGFAEAGTHLPEHPDILTGIGHLKELGVTHVQLMPPFDAHNDESKFEYNWGYMTAAFFSPEGIYSSDIRTDARIRELKALVAALHQAGIGVIFDIVVNHTSPGNPFETLAPGYYHRMRDDGSFWNGSGTGNEVRSEAPMARQFILDCVRFWMEEYGIDGYRFDLMGLTDLETMLAVRELVLSINPNGLVYGEPWAGGASGLEQLTDKQRIRGTGIGAFNDHIRDAIKGSTRGTDGGYVQNGSRRDDVKRGIAGAIDDWTSDPHQALNYVSAHDDLTLWDKLIRSAGNESAATRERMHRMALGLVAVSQGGMFLHGGSEMLRTKNMVENSYNAGDEINAIDWTRKQTHRDTVEYVRGLIALRRAHPVFRLGTAEQVRARLAFRDDLCPHPNAIVFTLDGAGLDGEEWTRACVLANPTAGELIFQLPTEAPGLVFVLDARASTMPLQQAEGALAVPARSIAVIAWGE
jgi:pullulanase